MGRHNSSFVICDVICIPRDVCDAAKALIAEQTGIPGEQVLIAGTHTHSAPAMKPGFETVPDQGYLDFFSVRVADAVQLAAGRAQPAKLGYGVGKEPRCVFNRRFRMRDGTVKMNPGSNNPDIIETVGPTDSDIAALFVETVDGEPIAVLANYALHYVGAPGHMISADYFGLFAEETSADSRHRVRCDALQRLLRRYQQHRCSPPADGSPSFCPNTKGRSDSRSRGVADMANDTDAR